MKKSTILILLLALLFAMIPTTIAEGLLPELEDFYGVAMPSLFDTLKRSPDEQKTLEDESIQEIWYEVTDEDYSQFGDHLSKSGCEMVSYTIEGSIFNAEVAKDGKSFFFNYDNEQKRAILVYPQGTYDGGLDEAERMYKQGLELYSKGDVIGARYAFWQSGRGYKDSNKYITSITEFSNGKFVLEGLVFCISPDGTVKVASAGDNDGADKVQGWNKIKALSASYLHTVGLKDNGTVLATGINRSGACNVKNWKNVVKLYAQDCWTDDYEVVDTFTIGLKEDGTVVATGNNDFGQCNVSDWTEIADIITFDELTIGIKKDGTIVCTDEEFFEDLKNWDHIISVSKGSYLGYYVIGLKDDGTVVTGGNLPNKANLDGWNDIISVKTGSNTGHIVGLKANGTVVSEGYNNLGQCNTKYWTDIVAIAVGEHHTVGLKADGTVIAKGDNSDGQCNVSNWTDIVAVYARGWNTYGVKSDGTILATGWNKTGYCNVDGWALWDKWDTSEVNSPNEMNNTENSIEESNVKDSFEGPTTPYKILKKGAQGDAVVKLQIALIEVGALSGKADGDFGRMTEDAVKQMQAQYGMEATGIADEEFQKKLYGE